MSAETLDDAIDYVNAVPYGLTSGIHSLDPEEIATWTEQVAAGNLYINRGITGAIVRRQPFGGWKRSAIGPGTKAGGPNYLMALTDWQDDPSTVPPTTDQLADKLSRTGSPLLEAGDLAWLSTAVAADAVAVETFTGQHDISNLQVEVNVLRYRPVPVAIRLTENTSRGIAQVLRVAFAGLRVHNAVATGQGTGLLPVNTVSLPSSLPRDLAKIFRGYELEVVFEETDAWLLRVQRIAAADPQGARRIRLIGTAEGGRTVPAASHRGEPGAYTSPATPAGRVEWLLFVRDPWVTMTGHRFAPLKALLQQELGEVNYG